MTREERLEKQKQRLIEMKVPEEDLHEQGYRCIAGIDEVGRGPLAGPVVAAAVVLPEEFSVLGIDDSKKLSEKRREELFVEIKKHAVAWGIGMALFDLLSGWTLWAPFTLVIVGCMGFVVGAVTEKKKSFPFYLLALLLACAIKIGGYYLAEAVIYQNWVVPLTSIPGNLIQVGAAAIITLVVIEPLRLAACHTILRK